MKHVTKFLAAIIIFTGFISCKSDDAPTPNPNVTFLATLNGTQEAPPNASTFTGAATLTFNTTTKIFTVAVTHNVPTPTNGHIHKGAISVSGGVIFGFATFTSPITYTSIALTPAQEADLMANLYYVNIHTAAFPGGEIRGQLIKQ